MIHFLKDIYIYIINEKDLRVEVKFWLLILNAGRLKYM